MANLTDAVEQVIYVCTEGRPWVKTSKGFERIKLEDMEDAGDWPQKQKPYDGS